MAMHPMSFFNKEIDFAPDMGSTKQLTALILLMVLQERLPKPRQFTNPTNQGHTTQPLRVAEPPF